MDRRQTEREGRADRQEVWQRLWEAQDGDEQTAEECVGSANERAELTAVQFSPSCGNQGGSRAG